MYVFSTDGTTIEDRRNKLPTRLTRRLDTGDWETPKPSTATEFGFYPVSEVVSPGDGYFRSVVNDGPGVFKEAWTFDQALADAIIDQQNRDADTADLRADMQLIRDVKDNAVQSRAEMLDERDNDKFLSRWRNVRVIADDPFPDPDVDIAAWRDDIEARIEDQAKLTNLLVAEVRRIYGDLRVTAAAFVRKLRKDKDDI